MFEGVASRRAFRVKIGTPRSAAMSCPVAHRKPPGVFCSPAPCSGHCSSEIRIVFCWRTASALISSSPPPKATRPSSRRRVSSEALLPSLLLHPNRELLAFFSYLENQQLRGFGPAQVFEHFVNMHRRLVKIIARAVSFRRIGFHLILDFAFQDVRKHGTDMLVGRRDGSRRNRQSNHADLRVRNIPERLLHERLHWRGSVHAPVRAFVLRRRLCRWRRNSRCKKRCYCRCYRPVHLTTTNHGNFSSFHRPTYRWICRRGSTALRRPQSLSTAHQGGHLRPRAHSHACSRAKLADCDDAGRARTWLLSAVRTTSSSDGTPTMRTRTPARVSTPSNVCPLAGLRCIDRTPSMSNEFPSP